MARVRKCPSCKTPLDEDAVLCVDCGYHLEKKKHLKTVSKRVELFWDNRLPLAVQIGIGVVAVAVIVGAILLKDLEMAARLIIIAITLVLGATPLGFVWRLTLVKDRKGRPFLRKKYWFCFLPIYSRDYNLQNYNAVLMDYHEVEDHEYFIMQLRHKDGSLFTIYRGGDEKTMHSLADALKDWADLALERK